MTVLVDMLILLVLAFAWSIGAHYTGACMGMPYGSGSIGLWPSLVVMAILAFLGALVASHPVEVTVGLHMIQTNRVTLWGAIIIIVAAFVLTTVYTAMKVPTSTIQILVFSVAGMAIGAHIVVRWSTIMDLAIVWVLAPVIAMGLGYRVSESLRVINRSPRPRTRVRTFNFVHGRFTRVMKPVNHDKTQQEISFNSVS